MNRKKAYSIYGILEKECPGSETALVHRGAFQLLIATILSAQCTDERVNQVTKDLFKRYGTVTSLASADISDIEKQIRPTGFYRSKAKNIVEAARRIKEEFKGEVPEAMEDLITLPGVARKTANIVLFHAFGKNEGVAVDTHVKRLSARLGLSVEKDPGKIEKDLMAVFEKKDWGHLTDILICHGRKTCRARKPLCGDCALKGLCPSAPSFLRKAISDKD